MSVYTFDEAELEREYEKQGKKRYITLGNVVIDDAYGVFDYDGEKWVKDPFMSKDSADTLAMSKNKGAVRL